MTPDRLLKSLDKASIDNLITEVQIDLDKFVDPKAPNKQITDELKEKKRQLKKIEN